MANRAYLFSAETMEQLEQPLVDDDNPYCDAFFDSRWNIPITWWFLFTSSDVLLFNKKSGSQEIRLRSKKTAALERFLIRRPRLELVLENRIDLRHLDFFFRFISYWPGEYIVVDASEVLEDDDESEAQRISKMLASINTNPFDPNVFVEFSVPWSSPRHQFDDESRLSLHLVGAAYGETTRQAFEESFGSA